MRNRPTIISVESCKLATIIDTKTVDYVVPCEVIGMDDTGQRWRFMSSKPYRVGSVWVKTWNYKRLPSPALPTQEAE